MPSFVHGSCSLTFVSTVAAGFRDDSRKCHEFLKNLPWNPVCGAACRHIAVAAASTSGGSNPICFSLGAARKPVSFCRAGVAFAQQLHLGTPACSSHRSLQLEQTYGSILAAAPMTTARSPLSCDSLCADFRGLSLSQCFYTVSAAGKARAHHGVSVRYVRAFASSVATEERNRLLTACASDQRLRVLLKAGGGWIAGSSSWSLYNAENAIGQVENVLIVTVNYRVNVFGYLAADALRNEVRAATDCCRAGLELHSVFGAQQADSSAGNYGLLVRSTHIAAVLFCVARMEQCHG